jgi:spore coat polysaccharide biosynthesis predicted glycosyltransferase SpsG
MRTSAILLRPAFAPGGATGLGHVARSLALGAALVARGVKATLLAPPLPASWTLRARDFGVALATTTAEPGGRDDGLETRDLARRTQSAWVVLDGYGFRPELSAQIDRPIAAFADYGEGPLAHAALVIDGNHGAREEPYAKVPRRLLGLAFVPLRPEFTAWRGRTHAARENAREVLCTFGGSDPWRLTEIALEGAVQSELRFSVLIGADNARAFHSPPGATLLHDVRDLPEHAARADVAVIAAGTTLWELLFLQTPVLSYWISATQRTIVEDLAARGACRSLGDARAARAADLAHAIGELAANADDRARLARVGGALVDGRGAERIADVLLEAR